MLAENNNQQPFTDSRGFRNEVSPEDKEAVTRLLGLVLRRTRDGDGNEHGRE